MGFSLGHSPLWFTRAIRHAEIPSEFLNGRHARGDRYFLRHGREGIVQAPGGAGSELVDERFEIETGCFGQEADRQNALGEDILEHEIVSTRHLIKELALSLEQMKKTAG